MVYYVFDNIFFSMATNTYVQVAGSVIQDYGSVDQDAERNIYRSTTTLNTHCHSLFPIERSAAKGGGETA
jgi:hypothetical protein